MTLPPLDKLYSFSLCCFNKELNALQKIAYDMLRKDNMKPQFTVHEVKTHWDSRKEKMVAQSQRYANRVTQNSTVSAQLFI